MLRLGFNEFIKNLKKNVFVIIQLLLLYIIAFFMVSTIVEQNRIFKGIKGFLDDTGVYVQSVGTSVDDTEHIPMSRENLEINLKKVKHVEAPKQYGEVGASYEFDMVVNNNNYKVRLLKGKQCTKVKVKEGYVRALTCSTSGLKPGDTYEVEGYKFYITGIFAPDEWIFGLTRKMNSNGDYKLFFDTYDNFYLGKNNAIYLVVNEDDVIREGLACWSNYYIVDFEDDITEREIEENYDILRDKFNATQNVDFFPTDKIYNNTVRGFKTKLIPIVLAFVVVFIYSLFSLITSSAISFYYERRNYGIYFITGNSWGNTILLTLIHWGIVILSSLTIASCICIVASKIRSLKFLSMDFSYVHIIAALGIVVVQILASLFIPWRSLRKIEPVTIVKENER